MNIDYKAILDSVIQRLKHDAEMYSRMAENMRNAKGEPHALNTLLSAIDTGKSQQAKVILSFILHSINSLIQEADEIQKDRE